MVHFLNKGGGGGDLHGEKRGQKWSDGRINDGGASWREMRRGTE
jgi:hypothetical protein